jgi:hypothetical protein
VANLTRVHLPFHVVRVNPHPHGGPMGIFVRWLTSITGHAIVPNRRALSERNSMLHSASFNPAGVYSFMYPSSVDYRSYTKKFLVLVAMAALPGCSSPSGGKTGGQRNGSASPGVTQAPSRYEHQLDVDYSHGAAPFLRRGKAKAP